jgi:hypothetical protein
MPRLCAAFLQAAADKQKGFFAVIYCMFSNKPLMQTITEANTMATSKKAATKGSSDLLGGLSSLASMLKSGGTQKTATQKNTRSSAGGLLGGLSDLSSMLNSGNTSKKTGSGANPLDTLKDISNLTKGGSSNILITLGKKFLQSKLGNFLGK